MSDLPKCDCGAPMRWLVMRDGRRVPVDPAPTSAGTVWIDPRDGRGVFLSKDDQQRANDAQELLYQQHHATCPNVGRHRVPRAQQTLF